MDKIFYGYKSIFTAELSKWFKTKKWIFNIVLWLIIFNGFMFYVLSNKDSFSSAGMEFNNFQKAQLYTMPLGMFGAFGAIILIHDIIIGEINSGITSWLLSKPLSRISYVLAKTAGNFIGVFITMFPLQSALGFLMLTQIGNLQISINTFLFSVLLMLLHTVFYITITVLAGVSFKSRILVLAVPFGLYFFQQFTMTASKEIAKFLPHNLTNIATVILAGETNIDYVTTPLLTLIISTLAILITLYKIRRVEL